MRDNYKTKVEIIRVRNKISTIHYILRKICTMFVSSSCATHIIFILLQEPETAAQNDINKLQHVLELRRAEFENQWRQRHDSLESHRKLCAFTDEFHKLSENIDNLSQQIKESRGKYGESVPSAKATAQIFSNLEKSIEV